MTDHNGEDVPMTEPTDDPGSDRPAADADGWASPPAWGHTPGPSNWQAPTTETPASTQPTWQQPTTEQPAWQQPAATQPSWQQPATGGGGGGGAWNYGYGGLWSPP